MAHFDTQASRPESIERTNLRAARSWRAFALDMVAVLFLPALTIALLAIIEALLPRPHMLAERPRPQPSGAHQPPTITTACAPALPAPCAAD